jgi:predicted acetyltransferase
MELLPATPDQTPILANLLELYVHDFSEFFDVEINEHGKFGYPPFALYWTDPDRHPFVIRIDGKPAGLVFVKKASGVWDMAEFFIIRGARRRGTGMEVAHEVWRRFPGPWEVRVMQSNTGAQRFWSKAIAAFVGQPVSPVHVEKGGINWAVFSFESRNRYQLAQVNIGRLIAPIDDPRIAGFVQQLDPVNRLAEESPGFIWRLKDDGGNAIFIPFSDDPKLIVNMSVWESIEALRRFTYASAHLNVVRQRREWFENMDLPHYCLWWIPAGHIPTVAEARERLESYQKNGATPYAFWFSQPDSENADHGGIADRAADRDL